MPKGLNTKDRRKTVYFYSCWTAGVDYHYKNEVSSGQTCEENEVDSGCGPELDSDSESAESGTYDDYKEDSPPDLQEASEDSESDSDDEWHNETFVDIPEMKVKNVAKQNLKTRTVPLSMMKKVTQSSNHQVIE